MLAPGLGIADGALRVADNLALVDGVADQAGLAVRANLMASKLATIRSRDALRGEIFADIPRRAALCSLGVDEAQHLRLLAINLALARLAWNCAISEGDRTGNLALADSALNPEAANL